MQGDQLCSQILQVLTKNHYLTCLALNGNCIGKGRYVSAALQTLCETNATLIELRLASNSMADAVALTLWSALASPSSQLAKSLEVLDVSHNAFVCDGDSQLPEVKICFLSEFKF